MIRGVVSAVVVLVLGMAAGPSEAQYRVNTRFPWAPQHGSAATNIFSGQNRGAHFNPKELTIDKSVPWKQGQAHRKPYQLGVGRQPLNQRFSPMGFNRGMFRR